VRGDDDVVAHRAGTGAVLMARRERRATVPVRHATTGDAGLDDYLVHADWTYRAVARAQELGTDTTEASAADVLHWLATNQ
jgi:hypothetical protein